MFCTYSLQVSQTLLLVTSLIPLSDSTIDINMPELQYLSDHLTQEECHRLVATLHFQTFNVPQQVVAAERKLPEDVSCLDLLLHWNSQAGEGKGGTHVDVCHRLSQIGRRDLAEWLSKTVFHELSKDLEDSLEYCLTEETTRLPTRVTRPGRQVIEDESPWLGVDSVLCILIVLAIVVFGCGFLYLLCLCLARAKRRNQRREPGVKERDEAQRTVREQSRISAKRANVPSSEDETANLISSNQASAVKKK